MGLFCAFGIAGAESTQFKSSKVDACAKVGRMGEAYYQVWELGGRPPPFEPSMFDDMFQHIEDEILNHPERYNRATANSWAREYCMDHADAYVEEAKARGEIE